MSKTYKTLEISKELQPSSIKNYIHYCSIATYLLTQKKEKNPWEVQNIKNLFL